MYFVTNINSGKHENLREFDLVCNVTAILLHRKNMMSLYLRFPVSFYMELFFFHYIIYSIHCIKFLHFLCSKTSRNVYSVTDYV